MSGVRVPLAGKARPGIECSPVRCRGCWGCRERRGRVLVVGDGVLRLLGCVCARWLGCACDLDEPNQLGCKQAATKGIYTVQVTFGSASTQPSPLVLFHHVVHYHPDNVGSGAPASPPGCGPVPPPAHQWYRQFQPGGPKRKAYTTNGHTQAEACSAILRAV